MLCRQVVCFLGFTAVAVGFNLDWDSTMKKGAPEVSEKSGSDTFEESEDWTGTRSDVSDEREENGFKESEPAFDESKDSEERYSEDVLKLAQLVDKITHHKHTITVTNGGTWGSWGRDEFCPEGAYAVGYELKIERRQGGRRDDTALNGIKLFCEYPGGQAGGQPTSTEGSFGSWQGRRSCKRKYFLTQFRLKVEKPHVKVQGHIVLDPRQGFNTVNTEFVGLQHRNIIGWMPVLSGWGDDTAANFIDFKCRGNASEETLSFSLNRDYGNWGDYGPWSDSCRRGQAICGIKTRVEGNCGTTCDDTSLNDVKFYCCEL